MQNQRIRQSIFLYQISGYNRFINLFDIIDSVFFRSVSIRTGKSSLYRIIVKQLIRVWNIIIVPAIFLKTKWKYMNVNLTWLKSRASQPF